MKIETDPRVTEGPNFGRAVIDWMRRAATALNQAIDELSGISGRFASGVLGIVNGGTGASTAGAARTNLGAGTTGDSLFTATTAGAARTTLGLANHELVTVTSGGALSSASLAASTGGVVAQAAVGFQTNSHFADGSNHAAYASVGNPNFEQCVVQYYHVPTVWAGMRMIVGTTTPAIFEFRNNATGYSTGGWVATSDRRKKRKLLEIPNALNACAQMAGYTYTRPDIKDGFSAVERRYMGLIAQDVQAVAPEAVEDLGDADHTLAVNYGAITALNTQALKEVRALLIAARARIEALEALSGPV